MKTERNLIKRTNHSWRSMTISSQRTSGRCRCWSTTNKLVVLTCQKPTRDTFPFANTQVSIILLYVNTTGSWNQFTGNPCPYKHDYLYGRCYYQRQGDSCEVASKVRLYREYSQNFVRIHFIEVEKSFKWFFFCQTATYMDNVKGVSWWRDSATVWARHQR